MSPCPDAADAAVSEEFFRRLERRRTQALVDRDLQVLEELHAPDYQLITPSGKVFSRAHYLAAVRDQPFYSAWHCGEMSVRFSAAMAIVRYAARLQFPSGKELACWHTDSYECRQGRWQAVWSQATWISAPADNG